MTPRERFIIVLEPTPEGPPPAIRLRLLLKAALRRHGLRAVEVRAEIPHQTPQDERFGGGPTRKPSGVADAPESTPEPPEGCETPLPQNPSKSACDDTPRST